jgi:hypothetical protein
MLTPDEKDRIIERAQFEATVRDEIRQEAAASDIHEGQKWYENKLALLLIGSLITGFLVPVFQYTQEAIKWRRQNSYDAYKYRVGKMRDALSQLIAVQAYPAQAYTLAEVTAAQPKEPGTGLDKFTSQFVEIQKQRFQQNSRVSSLLYFYTDRARVSRFFNDYISSTDQFMEILRTPRCSVRKLPVDPTSYQLLRALR